MRKSRLPSSPRRVRALIHGRRSVIVEDFNHIPASKRAVIYVIATASVTIANWGPSNVGYSQYARFSLERSRRSESGFLMAATYGFMIHGPTLCTYTCLFFPTAGVLLVDVFRKNSNKHAFVELSHNLACCVHMLLVVYMVY